MKNPNRRVETMENALMEMLSWACNAGLARIADSPMGDGAVCANWFYLGGLTAERQRNHSLAFGDW